MEQLEDAVSSNNSEIYFAAASLTQPRRQRQVVSVGDHFWSSMGRQGRCYLLRLDALFVPIDRQTGRGAAAAACVNLMASVSVYYPTGYASHDVNYGLRLKRIRAGGSDRQAGGAADNCGGGTGGPAFFGFHRVFAPPADYELLRHPRPLTMTLLDFFACIESGMQRHSLEAWGERGLELPDFLASSGQRPRKSGKARVLVLPVSCFNRLQRCSLGHRLFGWSREDSLQSIGENRLFQCACGTRLFFCRRKHPLYHVNRHATRQEALAPKRRGQLQPLSLRTETEVFARFNLRCPSQSPQLPLPAAAPSKHQQRAQLKQKQQGQQKSQKQKRKYQKKAPPTGQKPNRTASKGPPTSPSSKSRRGKPASSLTQKKRRAEKPQQRRKKQQQQQQQQQLTPPSPPPPDLSPAMNSLTSQESPTPAAGKRRRYRPRLTAVDGISGLAAVDATIDSVIAGGAVGPGQDDDNIVAKSEKKKPRLLLQATEQPAFTMHLEAISPPSSPVPPRSQPSLSLRPLDSELRYQYIEQQQQKLQFSSQNLFRLPQRSQDSEQRAGSQQLHLPHQHHHQQQQQQQQQQEVNPNLFRLPHRDPLLSQQQLQQQTLQQQYQQQFLQQWSQAALFDWSQLLAPSATTMTAGMYTQAPNLNSCAGQFPFSLPPQQPHHQQQLQLTPQQPPAFVPIFITNPAMALNNNSATAGLLNLTGRPSSHSVGH